MANHIWDDDGGPTPEEIDAILEEAVARGLLVNSGKRRNGEVVWLRTDTALPTAEEILEARKELTAMGLLVDSGERRNGEIVWITAVEAARRRRQLS